MNPQLFIHHNEPQESLLKPIINGYTNKPRCGGLWTSTYSPQNSSEWIAICEMIHYKIPPLDNNWYLLYPEENARILEIDSFADCIDLYKNYSKPNVDFPHDEFFSTLNFESMQLDFDGLHLTYNGEKETRNAALFPNMVDWDCESTLWFRWMFYHWEPINKEQFIPMNKN